MVNGNYSVYTLSYILLSVYVHPTGCLMIIYPLAVEAIVNMCIINMSMVAAKTGFIYKLKKILKIKRLIKIKC